MLKWIVILGLAVTVFGMIFAGVVIFSLVTVVLGGGGGTALTTKPAMPANPANANLPRSAYVQLAAQDAIAASIPPVLFQKQINEESGFNPKAVSPAGAVGIAQFLPSTAAGLGINPYDPVAALKGAANYMASLSKQYGGDFAKALAAYNAGSGTVNSAIARCQAQWLSCTPPETQHYVAAIQG